MSADSSNFDGRVLGPSGPVSGAVVTIQATGIQAQTDTKGQFRIPEAGRKSLRRGVKLTAAHAQFFIHGALYQGKPLTITLKPIPTEDDATYPWTDPRPSPGDETRCGHCHPITFAAWSSGAHANSALNRRFRNLHDGSTWDGEKKGWSLRDEHPDGAGVCFACHAPAANETQASAGDLSKLTGVARLGVHCDFCHKVKDVRIDELGITHGRDAFEFLRPAKGRGQIFFGPLADVDRGEDVFSSVHQQSQFCAACHEGTVFGMPVYTTYSEWLESNASREGKSCQSCHMRPDGVTTNIALGHGGLNRSPLSLASHDLMPGGRQSMLRSALSMNVRFDEQLAVDLTTSGVGHATPTGYIDRHLLLVVEPVGAGAGSPLDIPFEGPRLESLAGAHSAKAGQLFARIVRDQNGRAPTAFWLAYDDPQDTRLKPDTTTTTTWRFPIRVEEVRVRLFYRRFWPSVRKTKRWPDDTIVVFDKTVQRTR